MAVRFQDNMLYEFTYLLTEHTIQLGMERTA